MFDVKKFNCCSYFNFKYIYLAEKVSTLSTELEEKTQSSRAWPQPKKVKMTPLNSIGYESSIVTQHSHSSVENTSINKKIP